MSYEVRDKSCPMNFDHESPEHAKHWPSTYKTLRGQCPIAWTGNHDGYWVATRYNDIVNMAQNSECFSSTKDFDPSTGAVTGGVAIPPVSVPRGIPVESDGMEWRLFRAYLNRKFGPKEAEGRRLRARHLANALLDMVIETGRMDLVNDLAGPLPAIITMELMGLPLHEWRQFADPLHALAYTASDSPDYKRVIENLSWIFQRCGEEFNRQRALPQQDGLLSYFGHEKLAGRYIEEHEVISFCLNIIVGGVDTTTALTTNALVYLHDHPEDKEELIRNPQSIPIAREEFLRYFTPIHGVVRNVMNNVSLGGAEIEKGDRVFLALSAANRDPEIFTDPDKIDIGRFPNRHVAFGAGSHRCIGSFLARIMFEEMVTAVLARIPDYRVDVATATKYASVGIINGWVDMPTTFPPGPKTGATIE